MNTLKNDILLRLEHIKSEASDIEITETSNAIMLSTYIHFDYIEVTVKKNKYYYQEQRINSEPVL